MTVAALVDGVDDGFRVEQRTAAGIDAQRDGGIHLDLFAERKGGREQQRRNVIHALVAVILQMAQDARLARAGKSGDNQKSHCFILPV